MKALAVLLTLLATPALAAESAAKEWGLLGEEKARFTAQVVDLVCHLSGDCPKDCGAGARQMGLVREEDGRLILPLKNGQPAFTGAAADLARYCGQRVEVDGVFVGDEEETDVKFYMVQLIRPEGAEEFLKANRWTRDWARRNPDAGGKGPWFRRDPRVLETIRKDGWLGLGAEADAAFLKEWFE